MHSSPIGSKTSKATTHNPLRGFAVAPSRAISAADNQLIYRMICAAATVAGHGNSRAQQTIPAGAVQRLPPVVFNTPFSFFEVAPMSWLKVLLFPLPALIAGAMSFYVWQLGQENRTLRSEAAVVNQLRGQLQEQRDLNVAQREQLESQVEQLQSSLLGAQAQMSNLSAALQEAREMIDPGLAPAPVAADPADSPPATRP